MWRLTSAITILFLGVSGLAHADDASGPELQSIVEQSAKRFSQAFADRDAEAVAALFTDNAEYADASGTIFHGRAVIGAEFAAAFEADPPGTMAVDLISIRPVAEGVIIEDGVSMFTPEGGGPVSQTRYTATHVSQADGTWLLASVRELEAAKLTPHDRLRALEWLIGGWHEDVGGSVTSTEWKWSDDGNFLISDFAIRQASDVSWTGTHRIGWDAERKQFRSWIFESGGGAAEGTWRANEDGSWSLHMSGVDAQGVCRSSLLTYMQDGEDAIVVSQDQRIVGGVSLPGSVHRAVRKPPELEVSASQR